jgi:hypothetical protein
MSPAMSPSISVRKIEANRRNAALSTGPTSPEGKQSSARYAISHGLTARQPLLPHEDPDEFLAFVDMYREAFRPVTRLAKELVAELADLHWRLRRLPAIEAQILNIEMDTLAQQDEHADKDSYQLMALAFERLVARRVLPNIFTQESRLNNRAAKIEKILLAGMAIQRPPAPEPREQPEGAREIPKIEPIRVTPQPGRNELCHCLGGHPKPAISGHFKTGH